MGGLPGEGPRGRGKRRRKRDSEGDLEKEEKLRRQEKEGKQGTGEISSFMFIHVSVCVCSSVRSFCMFMLGMELITTTKGNVYNGITDDETCRQPESDPIVCLRYWGLLVGRVAARVLLVHASLFFVGPRDQDGEF